MTASSTQSHEVAAEQQGRDRPRELDEPLESADPREVLSASAAFFPAGRLAVVSAFGPGTMVLLDMLTELEIRLPVVFVDTLHHFPETVEHVVRARRLYDLDLRVYRPAPDRAAFETLYGARLWERDLGLYQQVTKVEPFQRAIRHLDAYITGRRRDQASTRAGLPVIERQHGPGNEQTRADHADGAGAEASETAAARPLRINPLAHWSRESVWDYIRRRGVSVNSLHDRGYTSVGDAPLTTPVAPGEHERAGRWRGTDVLECGIHTPGHADPNTKGDTSWLRQMQSACR